MPKRFAPRPFIMVLCVVLMLSALLAIMMGAVNIPLSQWWLLFVGEPSASLTRESSSHYQSIVFSLRLPRIILAICVGAVLGICGAAMQGLFRNPLADPSLIGVTAGASLGASIVIVLLAGFSGGILAGEVIFNGALESVAWLNLSLVSLGAFVGGITAVIVVYHLARQVYGTSGYGTSGYGTSVATMLLAGIGITALSGSLTNLLEFYASNDMLRRISLWRMGGLEGASTEALILAVMTALLLLVYLLRFGRELNALLLGESEARHLGVNIESLKRHLIIVVAAGVGVAVALAGVIGFIGLVVPHIVRLAIGPDHRYLLPASALAGAVLLVISDLIARTLLAPTEIPVGIITAFVGVPFFISLLQRRHVYGG